MKRLICCSALVFGLVGFSSSVFPQTLTRTPIVDGWHVLRSGNTSRIVPSTYGGTGHIPITTTNNGLAGTRSGNMVFQQAGRSVDMVGYGRVPLGDTGKIVDAKIKAPISSKLFLAGLGAAASNPLVAIGIAVAAPAVVDWLSGAGVGINPNEADYPGMPFTLKNTRDGYEYRGPDTTLPWSPTPSSACQAYIDKTYKSNSSFTFAVSITSTTFNNCVARYQSFYVQAPNAGVLAEDRTINISLGRRLVVSVVELPASMNDIAPYLDAPDAPLLTPEVVSQGVQKAGIDPFGGTAPQISASGPSSVPGSKTTTSQTVKLEPGTTIQAPPGSPTTQPGVATTTNSTTHNVTYEGDKITYNTVNNTSTVITNTTTGDTTTESGPEETVEDDSKDEPPVDTPLGPIPNLYERKYPDGLTGIWNTKSAEIKQSPLFNLAEQLMPTGLTAGTCPSWRVDLGFGRGFGEYGLQDVSPPCWIWDIAKVIIIASALILARALVFGG